MSLSIDISFVLSVMLGNEWYPVIPGTFDLDAYEYLHRWHHETEGHKFLTIGPGGTGFFFECEDGSTVCGPIEAIQAIRYAHDAAEKWLNSFG